MLQYLELTAPGDVIDCLVSVLDDHGRFHAGRAREGFIGNSELRGLPPELCEHIMATRREYEGYAFLMAQRVVTLLEDDFDGSEASETILFALDGVEYAIDLNDAHASELRAAFSRFIKAARKTGGRTRTARPGSANAREVRLWAAGQGLQVNTRGRIQADIMEKYEAAH